MEAEAGGRGSVRVHCGDMGLCEASLWAVSSATMGKIRRSG